MTALSELPSVDDICQLVGEVWTSFLGDEIYPVDEAAESSTEVISSVSITGAWNGHLLLSLTTVGAAAVAQAMFETDAPSPEELADAVGELGNIIAGNVKSTLPEPSALSLPQVAFDAHAVSLPSARERLRAAMGWSGHVVVVSLWEAVGSAGKEKV